MLIWGIIAGVATLAASLGFLGRRKPRWIVSWFRPWGKNGELGFVRRVKLALSPYNHLYTLPLFSSLFLVTLVWLFAGDSLSIFLGADLFPGFVMGYAGAAALAYPMDLQRNIFHYRQSIAVYASQRLARMARPEVANEVLVQLAQSPTPMLRIAAAAGLRELGTREGAEALRLMAADQDTIVARAARDSFAELQQVYQGHGLLSVRTMDTYVSEHKYLRQKLGVGSRNSSKAVEYEKLDEVTRQLDEIVFSQLPLRRTFPDIYCQDCRSRAEHMHYEEWDWVRCRSCHEVHGLRAPVKRVVGQIGGDTEWENKEGTVLLNLWNDSTHQGLAADVDVLEIVGGKSINYDWAVGAVVGAMHDQGRVQDSRVAVRITNHPPLEPNSMQLLRTLDPSLIVETGQQPPIV